MKLQTIPFSELSKKSGDIYKIAVVVAKRAKQIITQRAASRQPYEEIIDEDYSVVEEVNEEDYQEEDKPIVVAMEEFLEGQLEWEEKEAPENALFD